MKLNLIEIKIIINLLETRIAKTEEALREGIDAYKPIIYQMDLKVQQDAKMKNGISLLERATNILFER